MTGENSDGTYTISSTLGLLRSLKSPVGLLVALLGAVAAAIVIGGVVLRLQFGKVVGTTITDKDGNTVVLAKNDASFDAWYGIQTGIITQIPGAATVAKLFLSDEPATPAVQNISYYVAEQPVSTATARKTQTPTVPVDATFTQVIEQ